MVVKFKTSWNSLHGHKSCVKSQQTCGFTTPKTSSSIPSRENKPKKTPTHQKPQKNYRIPAKKLCVVHLQPETTDLYLDIISILFPRKNLPENPKGHKHMDTDGGFLNWGILKTVSFNTKNGLTLIWGYPLLNGNLETSMKT